MAGYKLSAQAAAAERQRSAQRAGNVTPLRAVPPPRAEQREVQVTQSASNFLEILGLTDASNPIISIDKALQVPAVACALDFLPGELAQLPLHLLKSSASGSEKVTGGVATLLQHAANDETSSFEFRRKLWWDRYAHGRGLAWIERNSAGTPVGLWNMDPACTRVIRKNGRKLYQFDHQREPYEASDVIDLPWMLRSDGLGHYSPISRGARAINDMLAMQEYSSRLFSKGGVPPLALEGKLPTTGKEAMRRAQQQIREAIEVAGEENSPIAQIPPDFKLTPLGVNPNDGQMVEAKRLGIEEIARLFGLPPVFLQDLTHGTFSNTEQQDLHLVKHRIVRDCVLLEQELNLKLFGRRANSRVVKHNVDGLLRGDFLSRMDGITKAVQGGVLKPNEARALMDLPQSEQPGADELHIQGATMPLGSTADNGASE